MSRVDELPHVTSGDLEKCPRVVCDLILALNKRLETLEKTVAELRAENAELRAENAALRERLNLSSRNSGKPPSSDGPSVPPKPPKPPSGRPRGGQKGHPRNERPLLTPDEVRDLRPTHCGACKHPLRGEDPDPVRHQVLELPSKLVHVQEYRLHSLTCPDCQARTRALLPDDAREGYGPRMQALAALLTARYHLSKDLASELMDEVLGVPMAPATVVVCEQRVSPSLEPVHRAIGDYLRALKALHADETSWRESRRKAWLWVLASSVATFFLVRPGRDTAAAKELLCGFVGVLCTDRYSVYASRDFSRWQLCWSHLKRDFQRMVDRGGASAAVGQALLALQRRLFRWWHWVKDQIDRPGFGRRTRAWLQSKLPDLQGEARRALERGLLCGHKATTGTCRELLDAFESLWTFVSTEGVEPTNNLAERQLRPAVIWRKLSFGTDSARGSRFVERVMSVVTTLRQQKKRVLDYIAEQFTAFRQDLPMVPILSLPAELQAATP